MHPIERLRWVARATWAPAADLAAEAAWALSDLAACEPRAVLPACRRLLERRPQSAPLWWVAAEVLAASDPLEAAERCAELLDEDPTSALLEAELARATRVATQRQSVEALARADVAVVPVEALGPTGYLVDAEAEELLSRAEELGVALWLKAGVGCVLPAGLFQALVRHLPARTPLRPLAGVEAVAGPRGLQSVADALAAAQCPEPVELTAWPASTDEVRGVRAGP